MLVTEHYYIHTKIDVVCANNVDLCNKTSQQYLGLEIDRNSVSVSAPKTTIWTVSTSFVFGRILIDDFRQRFGFGRKSSTGFGGVPNVRIALTIYETKDVLCTRPTRPDRLTGCSDCVLLLTGVITLDTAVHSGYKSVYLCIRSSTAVS